MPIQTQSTILKAYVSTKLDTFNMVADLQYVSCKGLQQILDMRREGEFKFGYYNSTSHEVASHSTSISLTLPYIPLMR